LAAVAAALCVPRVGAQQPTQGPAQRAVTPPRPSASGPRPLPGAQKPKMQQNPAPSGAKPAQPAKPTGRPQQGGVLAGRRPQGLIVPGNRRPRTGGLVVAGAPPAARPSPEASKPDNSDAVASRRDPFTPLIDIPRAGGGSGDHLPPGKAGLVIATVRIDGAVRSNNGMIAVLSNPEQRVYFVREGDHLYDGDVEKISLDGITFKENARDAFGKPVERLVTKRIYPSAGEQQ
jgi:hypothetical protein